MAAVIRLARLSDAKDICDIYAPCVEGSAISFETTAPGEEEMASRVQNVLSAHPWLVAEIAGTVAGYAYASTLRSRTAYQWSCESSVYIAHSSHRTGLGRRLYHALISIVEQQGYRHMFAGVTLPNEGSVKLHEQLGFKALGVYRRVGFKDGKWHDVGWWQRAISPDAGHPGPIKAVEKVCAAQDWSRF